MEDDELDGDPFFPAHDVDAAILDGTLADPEQAVLRAIQQGGVDDIASLSADMRTDDDLEEKEKASHPDNPSSQGNEEDESDKASSSSAARKPSHGIKRWRRYLPKRLLCDARH